MLSGVFGRSEERSDFSSAQLAPAAITDTGCERELNEDRYAVVECDSGIVWIVCDGMGGVTGGELAAQLAIDAMKRDLLAHGLRTTESSMSSALAEANRLIVLRRQNQAFSGMGTTAVVAMFQGPEVTVTHIGDSRAYLVRGSEIQQLTVDHTYVQKLVDSGEITPAQALSHPDAHILTKCIGSQPGVELEILKFYVWPVEPDEPLDYLVLSTDGLYTLVEDNEIGEIVGKEDPQSACAKLVELAKQRGGFDNITVAIIPLDGQLRNDVPQDFEPLDSDSEHEEGSSLEPNVGQATMAWVKIAIVATAIIAFLMLLVLFLA
jgi:PPM family protein phosphatase